MNDILFWILMVIVLAVPVTFGYLVFAALIKYVFGGRA